nr:PREDICTED: thyrotropin-releasing hormone-degrading ectoenzyme isoform X2 [Linepithema humile]
MEITMAFRQVLLNVELIFIVIIILSIAKFTKNDTKTNCNTLNDTDIIPFNYKVNIKFDLYRNIIFGKCYTTIKVCRPTKNITIMGSETFAIVKINLLNNDNYQTIDISKYSFIDKTYIHLDFTQSSIDFLSPGTYILTIIYDRTILDGGDFSEFFYTHKEEKKVLNNKGSMIIKARQLFPCLNESVFKSTFHIYIKHHKNYTFLSNLPINKKVDDLNDMLWTLFDTSSLMSVEHLTFKMTTLYYDLNNFSLDANLKFWHRTEITEQMQYAKIYASKILNYLAEKNKKKLPELNYIIIRDYQFNHGKVKGFILLREEDVLYNETLDHVVRKMEIANLIAHETISYWYDDVFLWAKDGFIAFLAAHTLHQTYLYHMNLFVVQTLQESLRLDDSFHPSYFAYDSIVHPYRSSHHYIKSSVIWRTLYNIISDDVFWTAINRYVNTLDSRTTATDTMNLSDVSFWIVLESALNETNNTSNFNMTDLIYNWSMEGYYPTLYVTQNNSKTLITYSNYEYTFIFGMKRYPVYVTYSSKSILYFESLHYCWLSPLQPYCYLLDIDSNEWIIVNLQQIGYYRVNYNEDNWQKLQYYMYFVNYTHISVCNRAQIVDDAFHFMIRGQLNFDLFWDVTSFLLRDTNYVAWYPMIKAVEYMACMWAFKDDISAKNKIKYMFHGLLLNIEYDDTDSDDDFTKCLREEAIKWACILDASDCRKTVTSQLERHLVNSAGDEFLRRNEWLYCKGLMAANISIWRMVWNKWDSSFDKKFLEYLTCSTNTLTIRSYLIILSKDNFFPSYNKAKIANIFLLIFAKHARNNVVLDFIFNNTQFFDLSKKRHVDEIAVLIVIITHEHEAEQFKKISEFVKNNPTMNTKQVVDAVEHKIEKRKKEHNEKVEIYRQIDRII